METESLFRRNDYRLFMLANGLRCVYRRSDSRVAYIGVAVNAGSRDEEEGKYGLAHFVEHTIFKGAGKRSSFQISERMESVGGELNAYTSKENTVFYTIAPAGDAARAIGLLADLMIRPTFPHEEVEREKEVVLEELKDSLDNPAEALFDQFERKVYAGSDLGHDILGTPETVHALRREDCLEWVERFYTPGEMVVFVQSPDSQVMVERLLERHFGLLGRPDTPRRRVAPAGYPEFRELVERGGHQAHTLVGSPAFGRHDPRRYALMLYNDYLGGPSMNSRLNRELREKRGLVYVVDSHPSLLSDCGMEYIYFGADPQATKRCLRLVEGELERICHHLPGTAAFEKMKKKYVGRLLVHSDNLESAAMSIGRSVLLYGEVHDAAWTAEAISQVSAEDFLETARLIRSGASHSLTLV